MLQTNLSYLLAMAVFGVIWRDFATLAIGNIDHSYPFGHSFTWYTSSLCPPFLVLIMTRLFFISFYQPKRWTPGCDYYYHDYYQHHRCRFDCSTGVILSKTHTSSRFGTQPSIYDSCRYLCWICSSHRFIQYIVHRSESYWISCIIYLRAMFGPHKCTCL